MSKIKAVVFDIGNVLVAFRWQYAIDLMQLTPDIAKRLANATVKSPVWNEFDRGEWSLEEIVQGFVDNDPEIECEIKDLIGNYYGYMVKQYDYAHEWIDTLQAHGYKVYYLSNFSKIGHEQFADDLDFLGKCDGGILSYEEKLIKPDEAIYKCLLDRYNIVPQEAVFIDDSLANVEGARRLGINAIHFTNRQEVLEKLRLLGVQ